MMPHCPYCGTNVKEDEWYCIKCGKELPNDMYERMNVHKHFNRFWLFPIFLTILLVLSSGVYYFMLQSQNTQAKKVYEQGEQSALDGDYREAKDLFEDALDHKSNFQQADTSLEFINIAISNQTLLEEAQARLNDKSFQEALTLINEAESDLNNYNGAVVTQLINNITTNRNAIKIAQLNNELEESPSIDNLKILLWEAESINNEEADKITANIREQIINYTFSKASEQLNANQFSDALTRVNDGLKYAPDSEKLQSLKTSIDKEKVAFETAQQKRIEQAINTAAEEQQLNETDAIKLTSVSVERDDQGKLAVKGEVESIATIPINSISVEYALVTKDDKEILTNDVYVFPDTLYPDEKGKFEFTHYDIDEKGNIDIKVNKIKWYTE